jgi:diguanylate cyclase (GGDEF)-like protein
MNHELYRLIDGAAWTLLGVFAVLIAQRWLQLWSAPRQEKEADALMQENEQMRVYAEQDFLTCLWNRRIIVQRLQQELDRAHRENSCLSLILIDLDHFKEINDTFGHPAGDYVLQTVAAIFQKSMRSYDSVGRYGGDEFLILLPGANLAAAQNRAEQLRTSLARASFHAPPEHQIIVSASFGVVSSQHSTAHRMIQAADALLYRAKHKGRNCVVAAEDHAENKDNKREN